MSRFLSSLYASLEEYVPGEQPQDKKYVKLNTNESPFPPSPGVIAAVTDEEVRKLCLYSDPESKALKQKLAESYSLKSENVFVANGSDDILNFAFMAFARENGAVFPDISYGFYPVFADLYNVDAKIIPLEEDFSIDYKKYLSSGRMVVIANPNAPTGKVIAKSEIEEIIKTNSDNIVLIDEAYVDFGAESVTDLVDKYDNLLVVGTFSKSRSMAGARLGFAFANTEIIKDLEKIKYSTNPYNINRLTQLMGVKALEEQEYYDKNCAIIAENREFTVSELEKIGFTVIPSKANFIFAKHSSLSGEKIYLKLKEKGVLIRHFTAERIKDHNRITIGTKEQMMILIEKLIEIIGEEEK
ncbi:MAG: histidinol-phosphate transaminase [Ruminococcaceae bacterium]|nr:histidinol-phosphate transaminase [Oscillospiraceae bacterium]